MSMNKKQLDKAEEARLRQVRASQASYVMGLKLGRSNK